METYFLIITLHFSLNCLPLFAASATFYNKLGRIHSSSKLLFYTQMIFFHRMQFSLSSESKVCHKFLRIRNTHIKTYQSAQIPSEGLKTFRTTGQLSVELMQ